MSARATAREFIRHLLFKTSAYPVLNIVRKLRGQSTAHLSGATLRDRFNIIYQTGVWQHGNAEVPESGHGSTFSGTEDLRKELPGLLNDLGIKTLLDVGCGDFSWMRHVSLDQQYVGVDLVEAVVERNSELYADSRRSFLVADAAIDELPSADAVICREVLFHLSFADIRKVLKNIVSKDRQYLILTTDRGTSFNSEIASGDYRLINLEVGPFRLPSPLHEIRDSASDCGRVIGVWRGADVRQCLAGDGVA